VLRTALKPKWLGLLVLVLALCYGFFLLGRWQLEVARDSALKEQLAQAKAQAVVTVESVLKPHQAFPNELSARAVSATGHYEPTEQVTVPDRRLDGAAGYWVVTALHTDEGPVLPVLRGFVTDAALAPAPPDGRLMVVGGLAPGESPVSGAALPDGQLRSVDLAVLVNRWDGDLYNAFVFAQSEEAVTGQDAVNLIELPDLHGLQRVPTPTGEVGLNWRNAAYAAQWWVFALFALWMWWRMVRDDHRKSRETEADDATPAHGIRDAGRE